MATVREVEVMDETAQDPEAGLPALADARGGACGARVARTSAGPRDRGRSGCRRVGQAPRRPLSFVIPPIGTSPCERSWSRWGVRV
jgi:hypothetical protein